MLSPVFASHSPAHISYIYKMLGRDLSVHSFIHSLIYLFKVGFSVTECLDTFREKLCGLFVIEWKETMNMKLTDFVCDGWWHKLSYVEDLDTINGYYPVRLFIIFYFIYKLQEISEKSQIWRVEINILSHRLEVKLLLDYQEVSFYYCIILQKNWKCRC